MTTFFPGDRDSELLNELAGLKESGRSAFIAIVPSGDLQCIQGRVVHVGYQVVNVITETAQAVAVGMDDLVKKVIKTRWTVPLSSIVAVATAAADDDEVPPIAPPVKPLSEVSPIFPDYLPEIHRST